MADKREPPFFNDDNLGIIHYKLPFSETMELFIETLTGTCFRLQVSPFETVISIKAKIQRLEGIPVAQQHLIWNNVELDDEYCLHDYSIAKGCTLKLVLAMRGGPINTRRVINDSVKEMCDCSDSRKDEVWEKSLSNKQVTFLLYREGDQVNFFRVMDRGDGTLTPVSESLSNGSGHNVCAEEEGENVGIYTGQRTLENSITMTKMKLLKAKMDNMNLHKKSKKTTMLKIRPPAESRLFSGSLGLACHHRMLRIGPASATHLPPIGNQQQPSNCTAATDSFIKSSTAVASLAASNICMLQQEEKWNNHSPQNLRLPPSVSRLDLERAKVVREPHRDKTMLPDDRFMKEPSTPIPFDSLLPDVLSLGVSAQQEATLDSLGAVAEPIPATPLLSQAVVSDSISMCSTDTKTLQSNSDIHTPPHVPLAFTEFTGRMSHTVLSANKVPPHSPPQTVHGIVVDSPSMRPDTFSRTETQDNSRTDKHSKKLPSCVSNTEMLSTLDGSGGQETLMGPCGLGRLRDSTYPLQTNFHLFQEDLLQRIIPLHRGTVYTPSGNMDSSSGPPSSIKRLGSPTYRLPPLKVSVSSKKKTSKHCFLCGKKTGLATSYECRCGNNFCSSHRYAETHDCTYDYKTAGRRFLQRSNPIINAPKLPKI